MVQKDVNLIDLVKSCPLFSQSLFLNLNSDEYFVAKIGCLPSKNEPRKIYIIDLKDRRLRSSCVVIQRREVEGLQNAKSVLSGANFE